MLVQRQHMQGEEVAGMNVPRDQPHLTSAGTPPTGRAPFLLFHVCLRIEGFPPFTIIRAFASSKSPRYVIQTLQVQVSHEARFQQRLEAIQGPPSPQASVSAMMLSLQRRVESQR